MSRPGHKVKQLAENRTLPGAPDLRQGKPKRADNIRQAALVKLGGRGRLATAGWKKRTSWDSNKEKVTDPGAGMARNYAGGVKLRQLNERRQAERASDPGAALVSMSGGQRVGWGGGGAADGGEYRQWRKERVANVMREGAKVIGGRTWRPLESRLRFDDWSDAELRPVARGMIAGSITTPGSMVPAVGERLDGEQMLLLSDAQWRVFLQWAGWTAAEARRLVRVGMAHGEEYEGKKGNRRGAAEAERRQPKAKSAERRVA